MIDGDEKELRRQANELAVTYLRGKSMASAGSALTQAINEAVRPAAKPAAPKSEPPKLVTKP